MALDKRLGQLFWRGMRQNRRIERRVNRWGQQQLDRHWPWYGQVLQPRARVICYACLLVLAVWILAKAW